MKNMLLYMIIGVLLSVPAMAHEDFEIAEQLINESIPCSQLSEDQLEMIGDYVMEQMHPGEQHEIMDQMMGTEGSESLRQMHITMAKRFYCKEPVNNTMMSGMMGMMGSMSGIMDDSGSGMMGDKSDEGMMGSMIGSGMMGRTTGCTMHGGGKMAYGMMGNGMTGGYFWWGLLKLVYLAGAAFVVGIIFWWTKKLVLGEHKGRNH